MNKHYPFHSIQQFRNVIKLVKDRCDYDNVPLPTLTFNGTVKLHGTNASVVITSGGEFYAQSRQRIITPEQDNAGFASFAEANKETFIGIANKAKVYNEDATVVIYGEWCGSGIQKGVACSQLPKMFVIFDIKLTQEEDNYWFSPRELLTACILTEQIKCIQSFQTFTLDINFNNPELVQNKLIELTKQVEACCPVASAYGVQGIGEGIVWTYEGGNTSIRVDDLIFKTKGEKHSDTKVKTLVSVDIERVNSIKELAESLVTEYRLEKAVNETGSKDIISTGVFLKWICQDIHKEDLDTITENGFEFKEVIKQVSTIAKNWYLNKL